MKKGYNLLVLKALNFFIENPYEEIHLREFSRQLKISLNSAQRFLDLFLREKFIHEFRRANLRYFKSNLDSIVFRNIKLTSSLKLLEDSGLVKYLEKKFSQIILFGSLARGLDNLESDIDILCIGKKQELEIYEFEKKLKKEINIHTFSLTQWKKQKLENKAFYQQIISTGVSLIGEIPILD